LITLRALRIPRLGLEAEEISPENLAQRDAEEIRSIELWSGKRRIALGKVFDVFVGNGDDAILDIWGDISRVKRLGQGMSTGKMILHGGSGMHLGNQMTGGEILVEGDVASWCGSEMKGGSITVKGSAGHYLGGSYRGSSKGMQGGRIEVFGSTGNEAGCRMVAGEILLHGSTGDFCGIHQTGGLITVGGACGARPGASMMGGCLILDGEVESLLPGAEFVGSIQDPVVEGKGLSGLYLEFKCDMAERRQGRILLRAETNPRMSQVHLRA